MWVISGGHILLATETHDNLAMNFNWRSFVGIPYLGAGQKLKTRRVFDIALGGHQGIVDSWEGKVEWEDHKEDHDDDHDDHDDDKEESYISEWPACVFIGSETMVAATNQMFAAEGHGHYSDCEVVTNQQAAAFFGKPGTFYSDCLFMSSGDLASATKMMFERDDHAMWNGCQVIS